MSTFCAPTLPLGLLVRREQRSQSERRFVFSSLSGQPLPPTGPTGTSSATVRVAHAIAKTVVRGLNVDAQSDEQLVERAKLEPASASACFEELYKRYHAKVAAWCLRMSGDREEAADTAQEVFLRIHSRLHTFRGESRFSTWLYQVARSVAINRGEYAARRKADSLDEEGAPEIAAELLDLDASLDRAELSNRLREAMARDLSVLEGKVLILHFVHGWTLGQITERLALDNKSGAKAYIVNGLRKLKAGFGAAVRRADAHRGVS